MARPAHDRRGVQLAAHLWWQLFDLRPLTHPNYALWPMDGLQVALMVRAHDKKEIAVKKPDPVINTLRNVPGLRGQSDRALTALAPLVDEVDIPAGERLTREGLVAKEAFVVVE